MTNAMTATLVTVRIAVRRTDNPETADANASNNDLEIQVVRGQGARVFRDQAGALHGVWTLGEGENIGSFRRSRRIAGTAKVNTIADIPKSWTEVQ